MSVYQTTTHSPSGTRRLSIKSSPTKEHDALKLKAESFLLKFGCTDIQFEQFVSYVSAMRVKFDVIGYKNEQIIAVECGGIGDKDKVKRMSILLETGNVTQIYLLPFGEKTPIVFSSCSKYCPYCGHKI